MISTNEAKNIISRHVSPLQPVLQSLSKSAGLVLAVDVFAAIDIPAYRQSSMDGYAFSFDGWQTYKSLSIAGEMAAGSGDAIVCSPEKAIRIFTGAAVPEGADTVVMQEKVIAKDGRLIIQDHRLSIGGNIRPKGSEIKARDLALPAGTTLSPAAIGFLAGIGIYEVYVYPKPSISIIVTGKELQQPGKALQYGQVYESNSATLTAALQQLNISNVKTITADDDLQILNQILQQALKASDVVLLTGGISVGDYDFVLEAANQCGVTKLFHKLKQKPGKPLYFGNKGNKPVFGLPGNPSSVLTCFYEYVIPALNQLSNHKNGLRALMVPLANAIDKPAGLTHFLKGFYDGEKAMPLDAQESFRLSSFAKANCLIKLNEDTTRCNEGEMVEIHLLPG